MSAASTIVKVQLALFQPDGPALVYPEDRKHEVQMKLPDAAARQMGGGEMKAYFRAIWTGSRYTLRERVTDQSW